MKIPRIQLGLGVLVMVIGCLFTVVAPVIGPKYLGYYGWHNGMPTVEKCIRYSTAHPYGYGCNR